MVRRGGGSLCQDHIREDQVEGLAQGRSVGTQRKQPCGPLCRALGVGSVHPQGSGRCVPRVGRGCCDANENSSCAPGLEKNHVTALVSAEDMFAEVQHLLMKTFLRSEDYKEISLTL